MLLGVVSDTHAQLQYTQNAVRMLESLGVSEVIHCGDVGSTAVIPLFAPWPTHFVLGNVDHYCAEKLAAAIRAAGQTYHARFGALERDGVKIAFLHSDDGDRFDETVASGEYDLVCYGHTHIARQEQVGRTLVLNPGAIYRANPHSLAVVELPARVATIVPL